MRSRVRLNAGCPACSIAHESAREVRIRYELAAILGFDTNVWKLGPRFTADMACADLAVVVEYDGAYHHQAKSETDLRKTARLRAAGWRVIRMREAPLERLGSDDLIVSATAPIKPTVDTLLLHMVALGIVARQQIEAYLASGAAVNQEAAEAYLTTKRRATRRSKD